MIQSIEDLASSVRIKRDIKRTLLGAIDFRENSGSGRKVRLVGGPFDGKTAVVDDLATYAWVAGDYFYRQEGDSWVWWYDAFS